MNFRKKTKAESPDLNLTPLVDVVLLLVLFFMVTAQFDLLPGLKLALPGIEGDSQVRVQANERLEVTIDAAGDVYFEDQSTTIGNLAYHLRRTGASGDEVVVVVSADRGIPYGRVVRIMDILRQEGFNRVVFAAQPGSGEEDGAAADD
ncbi:MAG: biopolymer transporter ExbD [Candidatus Adiutrix sp.]|jgi:biopolymer transport protein ExbD|nr:biopolymer transporter ExbD [Candidatus Adiutrix sp.]